MVKKKYLSEIKAEQEKKEKRRAIYGRRNTGSFLTNFIHQF